MPKVAISIMAELKSATRAQHEAAERIVGFEDAIRDRLSYRRLLEKFYGFYAPIEKRLANVRDLQNAVPDVQSRMKTRLLIADVKDLGGNVCDLPLCSTLPALANVAESIGCLYVLEGATLGGQILSRQAKGALGIGADNGARFFSSYGQQVGAMWKRFSKEADAYCDLHPEARAALLKTAADTFSTLSQWMQRPGNSGHAPS